MRTYIKNKIIISFAALVFLILVSQLIFNVFFATQYYMNYKSKTMDEVFVKIRDTYDGTSQSIEKVVFDYEDKHNIQFFILSSTELIYGSFGRHIQELPRQEGSRHEGQNNNFNINPNSLADRMEYLKNPVAKVARTQNGENPMLSLFGKFDYNDTEIYVSMDLPVASIESSASVFTNSSLVILTIGLILSLFLSIIISKHITDPIREIEEAASSLANLDFSVKVNEDISSIELKHLAQSINAMSTQLHQSMTDLNIANEQLQKDIDYQKQIEQMRREFIGNVSHEMKTPLALLQLYTSNLKNDVEDIDREFYYDTIIEETEYLNSMVVSMLDISSIESGLLKMEFENICLSELATNLVERMHLMFEDFIVETNITENINISGDRKYLEQAMKNFLTNAVEHTEKGGLIKISLNDGIVFSVFNEGVAILEDDIQHIWGSFYRSDKARVRTSKNVGLGLNIVKTVIQKHNGLCYVENINNGVEFSFTLPKITKI